MKRLTALTAFLSLVLLMPAPAAEAPGANQPQEQQILVALKQVQNQQATIVENQAKIDAKVATIAEALRVARIFSSRGGGK